MLQAFIIVAREGLESVLIAAIVLAYLKKSGRFNLIPVMYTGIVVSILLSLGLGSLLMNISNNALLEGILGSITAVMVASLIIHMWRVGPSFKQGIEAKLAQASSAPASKTAIFSVFLLTVFLITREGMETALMLYQVKNGQFILGSFLGLGAAIVISYLWVKFGYLVNLKRFFQVTGVYLVLFMCQVALTAFHELCEAGVFAQSEHWHAVTEPYSPDGMYGKWFSFISVMAMGIWILTAAVTDHFKKKKKEESVPREPAVAQV